MPEEYEWYDDIREKLQDVSFPCTLVVYGPSRTHRTTYRGEHSEVFAIDEVHSIDAAVGLVSMANYAGWMGDLRIYAIHQSVKEIKPRA